MIASSSQEASERPERPQSITPGAPPLSIAPEKLQQLRESYARRELILFVGAGMSLSLGLPPWSALIEHMANDESIVLDESSYFRRLDFESPLDIKLRADILGRSVLFIGYSLADINIRYLFYRLSRLWQASVPNTPQPVSYIFSTSHNPVQEAVLAQWGIRMISLERDDSSKALIEFLEAVVS